MKSTQSKTNAMRVFPKCCEIDNISVNLQK